MNKRKGFTLVELLVVIAIIALLMSMLMPALNMAKEQAKRSWCLANQRGVMLCTRTYIQGNDDWLPQGDRMNWVLMGWIDLPVLLMGEGINPKTFHCPGDIRKPGCITAHMDYFSGGWYTLTDSDWLGGAPPPGVDNRHDFSYRWPGKMYNKVGPNRLAAWPYEYTNYRLSDIRYPSRLFAFGDENYVIDNSYHWAHCPPGPGKKGIAGGFLDGHAKFHFTSELDIERFHLLDGYNGGVPGSYGWDFYTTGATVDGIKGYDVK